MGCSPWGPKELDTTEQLAFSLFFHFQLSKLPGNSLLVSYCSSSICSKGLSPHLDPSQASSLGANKYFYWESFKVTTWVLEQMMLFALKAERLMRWMVDGNLGESNQLTSLWVHKLSQSKVFP